MKDVGPLLKTAFAGEPLKLGEVVVTDRERRYIKALLREYDGKTLAESFLTPPKTPFMPLAGPDDKTLPQVLQSIARKMLQVGFEEIERTWKRQQKAK